MCVTGLLEEYTQGSVWTGHTLSPGIWVLTLVNFHIRTKTIYWFVDMSKYEEYLLSLKRL